jgi:CheY-like chemotaxis protein
LNAEQAQRQVGRATRIDDAKRRRPGARLEPAEVTSDASLFGLDAARLEGASRGLVLLIASSGEGRLELGEVLSRHPDTAGLVATALPMGLLLAERYRPELAFVDLGLASVHAFEACRAISALASRSQRRCRVVAGTATLTDAVEKPALMAGAANVTLFPFAQSLFETELDRLEERLGPRRIAKK